MKTSIVITITFFCCAFMVGCAPNEQKSQNQVLIDSELVNALNDTAIQNAIVSQHTLYPYHFMENGTELNELGRHDFAVLTKYFVEHPGSLNIRRGDVPADLYEARVNMIVEHWKKAGIKMERVHISDGMPGGPGMPSEKVVKILANFDKSATGESSAAGAGASVTTYPAGKK